MHRRSALFSILLFLSVALVVPAREMHAQCQWQLNGSNVHFNCGNVGVGTAYPTASLQVSKEAATTALEALRLQNVDLNVRSSSAVFASMYVGGYERARIFAGNPEDYSGQKGYLAFYTDTDAVVTEKMRITTTGNVGIGTTNPAAKLSVGSLNNSTQAYGSYPALFVSHPTQHTVPTFEVKFAPGEPSCGGCYNIAEKITVSDSAGEGKLNFGLWVDANGAARNYSIYANSGAGYFADSVGIGTMYPESKLHVVGNVTASNFNATYQDVAEWVPSSKPIAPGTVVIVDSEAHNQVLPSLKAYDTRVAGVVSESPGILLGEAGAGKVKVATTGRVKVRVDARKRPIEAGDLLVSGDQEGTAMKSEPLDLGGVPIHRPGTLIGKALEPIAEGEGEILVLLSLQ